MAEELDYEMFLRMAKSARIEPRSEFRTLATMSFELFISYTDAGFSPQQAHDLVRCMVSTMIHTTLNKDN